MVLEELTEPTMIRFLVQETSRALPYFACFPKLANTYLKALLNLWGTGEEAVRAQAFLNIRDMAQRCPSPFLDHCLKGAYAAYVRLCRSTSTYSLPSIHFMSNCLIELYTLDETASYQHAFVYIRQMAIHLRNSLSTKTKEAYRAIYNHQFLHCLRFWAELLAVSCSVDRAIPGESPLQSILFPYVQVVLGAARLLPTAQFFPFRFHCARALNHLAKATRVNIPVAPLLLEVLDSAELRRKATPSTLRPYQFEVQIKASKEYLHTRVYQDGVYEELTEGLLESFDAMGTWISFPEVIIPAVIQIKRHIKRGKSAKGNKQLQQLLDKVGRYSFEEKGEGNVILGD